MPASTDWEILAAQVDRLAGAHELDGEHAPRIFQNLARLARRNGTHGNVVFLVSAGRDGIHAGGMRQHLVFGNERRRRVLHDHVTAVHAARQSDIRTLPRYIHNLPERDLAAGYDDSVHCFPPSGTMICAYGSDYSTKSFWNIYVTSLFWIDLIISDYPTAPFPLKDA